MTNLCGQRQGKTIIPFAEEDLQELYKYPEQQFLEIKIKGSKKKFSYRQLCFYFGSCSYIADQDFSDNLNSKFKVDYLTRLKLNFVEATVFDKNGLLHWIPKSLSVANCDQKDRQDFITQALEDHAAMVGIPIDEKTGSAIKEYKRLLESQ